MNKLLTKSLAALLALAISLPSGAQMFGGAANDDSLLGSMVPRAASTQSPTSLGIIGSSGVNISTVNRASSVKQAVITAGTDATPADSSEFQKYVAGVAGGPVPYFASTPSAFALM